MSSAVVRGLRGRRLGASTDSQRGDHPRRKLADEALHGQKGISARRLHISPPAVPMRTTRGLDHASKGFIVIGSPALGETVWNTTPGCRRASQFSMARLIHGVRAAVAR